jgi:hypothetical protein
VATLFKFDPSAMTWKDLSSAVTGPSPLPRNSHGFAAAGGKLYVHAGWNGQCEHFGHPPPAPCPRIVMRPAAPFGRPSSYAHTPRVLAHLDSTGISVSWNLGPSLLWLLLVAGHFDCLDL